MNGQKKAGRTSARPLFGSYGSAAEEAAAVSPAAAAAEKQDDPDAAVVKAASAAAAASTVISTSAMVSVDATEIAVTAPYTIYDSLGMTAEELNQIKEELANE